MTDAQAPATDGPPHALLAVRALLRPLARLALAQGLTHAALEELLKQALVQAADAELAASTDLPAHRRASRVTTTTGIHRREVTRLLALLHQGHQGAMAEPPAPRSHASELFAHWRSHAEFCDGRGSPRELPRQHGADGRASFEQLAQAITRDVHPRSLLDELIRLGLAAWDRDRDTVRLLRETFVPQGDNPRMLRTLANNVGSHLDAAVDNVLGDSHRHFEQALYAPGLSEASLAEWRAQVALQWQALLDAMVPRLEALIARDAGTDAPPGPRHRVRVGLYTHQQPEAADPALAVTATASATATAFPTTAAPARARHTVPRKPR